MSQCFTCPITDAASDRVRCCGETIERAVERITALGGAAQPIAAWAPGHYINTCFCGATFTAAKGSLHCLPCAIKAAETPRADLDGHEANRIDQLVAKSGIYQLLDRAGVPKPLQDQMLAKPIGPMVGQPIRFRDERGVEQRGIVCEPNDPRKSGTYSSATHGDIPVRFDTRNRKQRRAEAAKAR